MSDDRYPRFGPLPAIGKDLAPPYRITDRISIFHGAMLAADRSPARAPIFTTLEAIEAELGRWIFAVDGSMPSPEMRACLISRKVYQRLMWEIDTRRLDPLEVTTFPGGRLDPRDTLVPTQRVIEISYALGERPRLLEWRDERRPRLSTRILAGEFDRPPEPPDDEGAPRRKPRAIDVAADIMRTRASRGKMIKHSLKQEAEAIVRTKTWKERGVDAPTPKYLEIELRQLYLDLGGRKAVK
jgi:hypothetical protein